MMKKIAMMAASLIAATSMFAFAGCVEDGKSAYDIAVENGFTGTQQEWLDSLKGTDGKDGENGNDGENGKDGVSESEISVWDGTIPGWQNPTLSAEEIVKNRPESYVVNEDAKTVKIYDAEAFAWFAYRSVIGVEGYVGWTVSLKCDVDLNNQLWVPVGLGARSNAAGKTFSGTFDGEGHTIYNLSSEKFVEGIRYGEFENLLSSEDDKTETGWYINVKNHYLGNDVDVDVKLEFKDNEQEEPDEFSFGLFSSAYNATIKNLNVENVYIDTPEMILNEGDELERQCVGDSTGAIVGFAQYNLKMENCRVGFEGCTGVVAGAKCAGGLVGRFYGGKEGDGKSAPYGAISIKDCVNYLNVGVRGIDKKGGIIGYPGCFSALNIENCVNYGKAVGVYAGGIIGFRGNGTNPGRGSVTIVNCTNYGDMEGSIAGGIIAYRDATGGTGTTTPFFILRNCNNYGDVKGVVYSSSGSVCVGGLIGKLNINSAAGVVLDCFNYGNITVDNDEAIKEVYAGGMFGYFSVAAGNTCVVSGGSCGDVVVKCPEDITNKVAAVCFGTAKCGDRVVYPYGSVIGTGVAVLNEMVQD